MKKFRVYITYSIYESIEVEADTVQHATDKGYEYAEQHRLEADYVDIEVEEDE